jgi:nitrate reductase gamma subunit
MTALALVSYLAMATFVAAIIIRCVKISRMPLHLRWELYPVAHEQNAAYGGSVFEKLNWWKAHKKANHVGELKVMVPEILLLKGVHEHNRTLWVRSYPFHFGLYLLAAFIGLLFVGAIAESLGVHGDANAPGFAYVLSLAITVAGVLGFILLGAGSLALLLRRLATPALRVHSAAADFFNLIIFCAVAVLGLLTFGFVDRDFAFLRGFFYSLVTLQSTGDMPSLVAAEIMAGAALLVYIPLTHMSHFFTKWFTYHNVRWDDRANRVGSKIEAKIQRQLGYKVDWNATHINGGGKKTWVDVATEELPKP